VVAAQAQEAIKAALDGRLEDALDEARRPRATAEQPTSSGPLLIELQTSYYPRLQLGRTAELRSVWGEYVRLVAGLEGEQRLWVPTLEVLLLAHEGLMAEARAALSELMESRLFGDDRDETLSSLLVRLLDSAVLTEDAKSARVLYRRLAVLQDQALVAMTNVNRVLGAAAALLGDPESARAHYQRSMGLMEKLRFRPDPSSGRGRPTGRRSPRPCRGSCGGCSTARRSPPCRTYG